ncbi:hypothetical protein FBU31_005630 [Coemansia sp. 'formosensis']|nr:hypothetical protein FBU31_005630 [Coemansia sp. 'formosensis']
MPLTLLQILEDLDNQQPIITAAALDEPAIVGARLLVNGVRTVRAQTEQVIDARKRIDEILEEEEEETQ